MADIIKLLPDHVANQIAAGEVVQRPASVVKELIENSIDAGARLIKLVVKDAGKTLIQIVDDGKGMTMTDARMAFERHATSKIQAADDLFNLSTKGFRGEALASIAAIAHVEVKTKPDGEELGTQICTEGSTITSQEPVVTPSGTMIGVKNLFFNVPARRKFLKSDNVELRKIIDEFHRVALAHPSIAMQLTHNENELFNLPVENLKQRIIHIMGSRASDKLVPVSETTELVVIKGFIGKPEFTRKTKGLQYFFVNDRFIKHNYLHHAVVSAFEGLLQQGNNPSYFLYLDVPKDSVDINIHPTKTEVKFDDEHSLYAIVRASVKHALGQFSLQKIDFDQEREYEVPYATAQQHVVANPRIEVDPHFNPFQTETAQRQSLNNNSFDLQRRRQSSHQQWEALYSGLNDEVKFTEEQEAENQLLFNKQDLPDLNIFQLQGRFIVKTMKSGLLIVNQRNAHVRVLYERLIRQLTVQNGVSQQLLFPIVIHMNVQEVTVIRELREQLEATGFQFASLEGNMIEINGLPLELRENDVNRVLEQLVSTTELDLPDRSMNRLEAIALKLALGMAVSNGAMMEQEAMVQLLDQLFGCKEVELTPHGKKTFIKMTGDYLNSKFN
ncbi:MAG: DNA mismatch repair endonuclease MutL [Nonlabens sp.]